MKITPETWQKVEPLLSQALDLDAGARAAWLAALRRSDPEVAPLLERMLATHDRAERGGEMETVPKLAPAPATTSSHGAGDRVGPWRLLRAIGRGGMGEVWLAEQADGRVNRQVALKLPTMLEAGDTRAERFQRERDILARLEHPNIARLYDAGASQAGQPWLAMEFVEGVSLDAYVARERLAIPARLALFRQVLAAVAHAHRHLVVHRDIKPANILIDAGGQVKLLDFGIAKLVGDESVAAEGPQRELTRLGGRVLTLRYAAPEQAAEGTITTATDIYSLGVVLHELLTGLSPYRAVREGKPLTDLMLMQEDIAVPSGLAFAAAAAQERRASTPAQLARLLAGDLDAILLKALRRDPGERFAAVEAFDDDIRRHLGHRPVQARAGTWRYLAGRFARRHRLPIAMAATVLVTMAAGLVLAEMERRVAVAERARAERHFASVRKLANTFIFDVHGEIENLPGSLKAREMLVKTSLEYLDSLAGEAGADADLQFELAAAYRRIAGIQGQPGAAHTGDLVSAIRHFEKAKRLHLALDPARPTDIAVVREHTTLSYMLARAYAVQADPRWQAEIASTVTLAGRVAALPGATPRDRARVPGAMAEQAHLTSILVDQTPEAEALVTEAIARLEALAAELPGDAGIRQNLASTYQRAAEILTGNRRTQAGTRLAIGYRRKSLAMFAELRQAVPDDQRVQTIQVENLNGLASDLSLAGELRQARETAALARERHAALLAADPKNAEVLGVGVKVMILSASIARRSGDLARASREAREAIALDARLPEPSRQSREGRSYLTDAQYELGAALLAEAVLPRTPDRSRRSLLGEARPLLAGVVAFIAEVRAAKLGPMAEDEVAEREAALRACDAAIASLAADKAAPGRAGPGA